MEKVTKKRKLENSESISTKTEPEKERHEENESDSIDQEEYTEWTTEESCGITQYLRPHVGFQFTYKKRYSDFIVREVTEDKQVAKIVSSELPDYDKRFNAEREEYKNTPFEDKIALLATVLGDEIARSVADFYELPESEKKGKNISFTCDRMSEKADRTFVHQNIKKYFPGLNSKTQVNEGVNYISFNWVKKLDGGLVARNWPKDKPKYLRFALYKENMDTTLVVRRLAKLTGIQPKHFHIAGTKDKRAITCQYITTHKVPAEKMLRLRAMMYPAIRIGNFEYVHDNLALGSLYGNNFTITLRDIDASDESILEACNNVSQSGFINYYGTQRFGTGTVSTDEVGKKLLLSDWEGAVDLILKPRIGEKQFITDAREDYEKNKNVDVALKNFPRYLSIERTVLIGLRKEGMNNYLGAISGLNRNMQLMYVHAYQSLIWNKAVSKRLEIDSENVIVGDIVMEDNKYVHVTEETKHKYTLFDVYLPLVGKNPLYPNNEIMQYIEQIMAEDGLSPYDMERNVRMFSLPGNQRKILSKAEDFEFEIKRYNDYQLPLVDLENYDDDMNLTIEKGHPDIPDGENKALIISFTLQSSCYATMLIRELTHNPTCISSQRKKTAN